MEERQLTKDERKQINITKLFHEKRLNEKFNWQKLGIWIFLEVACVLTIYYFDSYRFSLIAKFAVVVIPIGIWIWLEDFRKERKESKKLLELINETEKYGLIKVREYECKKAIQFDEYKDEGMCYAMEIGENKLFFWFDGTYLEDGILPNSKFEIYEEENDMLFLFGRRINVKGNKIQAIEIRREIKGDLWGELPEHREIIISTVDKYLDEIERKYST